MSERRGACLGSSASPTRRLSRVCRPIGQMLTSFAVRSPSTDALGSAEAGRELCERVVDGETTGGGHIFAGTHSGNGISVVRWAPDAVCSSSTAAKRSPGKRSAIRTRAGHSRRWMRVIFPLTRRVAITSGELRTRVSTAKISWPEPCPHQPRGSAHRRRARPGWVLDRGQTATRRRAHAPIQAAPHSSIQTRERPACARHPRVHHVG